MGRLGSGGWLRVTLVLAAGTAAVTAPPVAPAGAATATVVTVDLTSVGTPVNPALGGLAWNDGDGLGPVEALHPATVRIDGALESASTAEGVLDLSRLLARVAEIRRIGAEPLVILSYMPKWLGEPNAHGRDPTRVPPSDLDKWEALIREVVHAAATAPEPAYRFEVWNEPDLPTFWQDLPSAFMDMAARTHRAVATVAAETGLPLRIGGPATAAPDPVYMGAYAQRMVADHLPLDFVSWHYYANHPFFGPDGNEGFVPDAVYQANARRNPAGSPRLFGAQPALVEGFVAPALAGSGYAPSLEMTEWNISAGGYDLRHGTYEGGAFVVGALTEFERSGLDGADYYRAIAGAAENPGDWGTVTPSGVRRPSWWALQAWNDTIGGSVLPVAGDDPDAGFWARAARRPDGRVDVFLAGFSSSADTARSVAVSFDGLCDRPEGSVGRLDPTSSDLATYAPATAAGVPVVIPVDLPSQSAAFVRLRCANVTADVPSGPVPSAPPAPPGDELPPTGGMRLTGLVGLLAVAGLAARRLVRDALSRRSQPRASM